MLYTIDKNNLLEESFRLDSPLKLQKFARRGIKVINSGNTQKFQQDMVLSGAAAPLVGGVVGGVLPSIISDESDGFDTAMGVVGGTMLGSTLGLGKIKRKYSPLDNTNTKVIMNRIQRDGYNPTSVDKSIIDKANTVVRQVNLSKYMQDIASKGRQ